MNIHFTNEFLFEQLKKASIIRVTVGSHLYGTADDQSDIDYLYIYATSREEINSLIQTQHQLQYKQDGIDHVFVSLHTFIRNIIIGNSTINFEVLHSGILQDTILDSLYQNRDSFNTYTIIKTYLGLAKRDIKHYSKANADRDRAKKLFHVVRGYTYAKMLYDNVFDFDSANQLTLINKSAFGFNDKAVLSVSEYRTSILRKQLNQRTDLNKKIDVNFINDLDQELFELYETEYFKSLQQHLEFVDIAEIFVNAYENWVEY